MSRYNLIPRPGSEQHKIVVGWDEPLNTFFAYVGYTDDATADRLGEVLWVGTSYQEIHDHEKVINAVRPYAQIPNDLATRLYGDAN